MSAARRWPRPRLMLAAVLAVALGWVCWPRGEPRRPCPLVEEPPWWQTDAPPAVTGETFEQRWAALRAAADTDRWRAMLLGLADLMPRFPERTTALHAAMARVLAHEELAAAAAREFAALGAALPADDPRQAELLLEQAVLAETAGRAGAARSLWERLATNADLDTAQRSMVLRILRRWTVVQDPVALDPGPPPVAVGEFRAPAERATPRRDVTLADTPYGFTIGPGWTAVPHTDRPGFLRFAHSGPLGLALEVETSAEPPGAFRVRARSLAALQALDFHRARLAGRSEPELRLERAEFLEFPPVGWCYRAVYRIEEAGDRRLVFHALVFPRYHRPFVLRALGPELGRETLATALDELLAEVAHLPHPWPEGLVGE